MKKQIAACLLSCSLFAFAAAEQAPAETVTAEEQTGNAFEAYDQKGYTHGGVTTLADEAGKTVMQIYFNSQDKTDCVLIEAALTDEDCVSLDSLDFFDEQFYEKQWEIITALPSSSITVTILNDRIPSEEEINQYVGKTVADLMADGYEWFSDAEDEDGNTLTLFHSFDTHINFAVDLGIDQLAIEDLSDEKIGSVEIKGIRFWGFED